MIVGFNVNFSDLVYIPNLYMYISLNYRLDNVVYRAVVCRGLW